MKKIIEENSLYNWCKRNNASYLLDEWDCEKNPISPKEISYGSNKKVWWKCPNGHDSYLASIINRRIQGQGCSVCNSIFQTSFLEQSILFYIK